MKKTKPIASPELTEELFENADLIQEYVEYLRSRMKRRNDGAYYCVTKIGGPYRCWEQTERFCREKGWDANTVTYIFTIDFGCESNVANDFNLDAWRKDNKRRRQLGVNI